MMRDLEAASKRFIEGRRSSNEANANDLSNPTGNTQEDPKSEAAGQEEAKPSVREESWPTSDWLRELYTDDRCNVGTPWKQANAEFDRWLRKITSAAWEEGSDAGYAFAIRHPDQIPVNPYKSEES